MWFMVVICVD
uniref:Uncharacterized protein n=1 Tax=Rhizophora mucronata TaxID=61149 RepID=A0A2P2QS63_RHIMU